MRNKQHHGWNVAGRILGLLLLAAVFGIHNEGSAAPPAPPQEASPQSINSLSCDDAAAQGAIAKAIQVQSGSQPGATDPMAIPAGRLALFPDQGIGAFTPFNAELQTVFYRTDKNSDLGLNDSTVIQKQAWSPNLWGPSPVFATAGRILTPDHDNIVYATRHGDPDQPGSVDISFVGQGLSTTLPDSLIPRQRESTDFIAIAQGDLDQAVGSDYNYHNEVVVVTVAGQDPSHYRYRTSVLNYSSGKASSPDVTTSEFVEIAPKFNYDPSRSQSGVLPSDNIVSVSVGDFLGDGHNEIAVTALGADTLLIYTYRYQTAADGSHTLTLVKGQFLNLLSQVIAPPDGKDFKVVGTLASTARDLDGDGADELAVAYAKWGKVSYWGQYAVGLIVFKYDADFYANVKTSNFAFKIGGLHTVGNGQIVYDQRPRVQLVSGQFLFNPPDVRLGRGQLVLAWGDTGITQPTSNPYKLQIKLQALTVSSDLGSIRTLGPNGGYGGDGFPGFPLQQYSLAAGGFLGFHPSPVGNNPPTSNPPTASLALSYWTPGSNGSSSFYLKTLTVSSNGISQADQKTYVVNLPVDPRARLPLVADDLDGKSIYLGAPVHITIQNAPQTDTILQEPPKHLYWDESGKKVQNLTRYEGNNVHLYNSETSSLTTKSSDNSSRDTGGSAYATAGTTITVGKDYGLIKANAEMTWDVGIGAGYDYSENESNWNSQYGTREFNSTAKTDHDDYVSGDFEVFDVWRYRVYGTPAGQPLNSFYEIVLPGPRVRFGGGGLDFDWYQPVHENGNILSYPSRLSSDPNNPRIPADIGPFATYAGKQVTEPLVDPTLSTFGGTSGSTQLQWSKDTSNGTSFTYSHTLSESLEIKASYKSEGSTPWVGSEIHGCGVAEFHNSNSFGGDATTTETSTAKTAVTLNKIAVDPSNGYPFYPVVYMAKDGTLKMAFSMPNPADRGSNSSGYETYATLYGGKPDPALNLPRRFSPISNGGTLEWVPNLRTNRKRMGSLFFREAQKNPDTGTYDFLSGNAITGDKVRIEARVYNYSTGQSANNITVQFQAIPYDSTTNSEICADPINAGIGNNAGGLICPPADRTTIGERTITGLNPLQFTCLDGTDDPKIISCYPPVFINWDTSGFGPAGPGSKEYRIYVVLKPSGDETYGREPAPVAITNVTNPTADAPMVITAPGNNFSAGQFVMIGGVQGLTEANGIYTVGALVSKDQFELTSCQPTPGCSPEPSRGRTDYAGGGVATLIDPGQNDEGYAVIGVTTPASASSNSSANDDDKKPQDYLGGNSLEAQSETGAGDLQDGQVQAYLGVPLELRLTAYSTMVHPFAAHALLFDGDPSQGAAAVADRFIHPGENGANGASVWIEWTPTTLGMHHLYGVLLSGAGAQEPASEIDVNVVPNPNAAAIAQQMLSQRH